MTIFKRSSLKVSWKNPLRPEIRPRPEEWHVCIRLSVFFLLLPAHYIFIYRQIIAIDYFLLVAILYPLPVDIIIIKNVYIVRAKEKKKKKLAILPMHKCQYGERT